MKSRKGFTLVELMVVVVIVALLAALLIPMLTARIEAARWSEGKAAAGTIATALRAYVIEKAELNPAGIAGGITDISEFMNPADLHGKYFEFSNFALSGVTYTPGNEGAGEYVVTYLIQVNPGTAQESGGGTATEWTKGPYTLDHLGNWTDLSP
jgi:prepilin-type N-terminal cleavage/methylation domain-containing protein